MEELSQTIAANLRRLRKFKKLSQKEVALQAGIPQGQYSRIESGKVIPTVPTIIKIATLLEVTIGDLFSDPDLASAKVDLPLFEKVRQLETLEEEEKQSIITIIDMALAKKRLKDNIASLAAS